MAEKLRHIKREQPLLKKRWKHLFLVGAASLAILAVAAGIWFFAARWKNGRDRPVAPVKHNDLTAIICRNGNCFWLNQSGRAFYQGADLSGSIIFNLADKTSRELKLGDQLLPPSILGELLFIKSNLREGLGISIAKAETVDPKMQDFDFTTTSDWTLRFSVAENAYKTLETLKKTLDQIGLDDQPRLEYIDLRVPNKVYYKLK
ncbi:MAG: hypothetical protein AAB642_01925 [Patescibacteria group bacterium]